MASYEELEEVRLGNHLSSSGLLTEFVAIDGSTQEAPELFFSEIDLTPDGLPSNKRGTLIRLNGGDQIADAAVNVEQYPMSIFVFGKPGNTDNGTVKGYVRDLNKWILNNPVSDEFCIVNIQTLSFNGPFLTDDNRRVYSVDVVAKFTRV